MRRSRSGWRRRTGRVEALTTVIAIAFLATFFVIEGRLRVSDEARSLVSGAADRGTTRGIGLAFGFSIVCVVVSLLVNAVGVGRLPEPVAWSGLAVMVGAIGLRVWAARALGASYARTLRTSAGQQLVEAGPYRLIRHPGYAADIVLWLRGLRVRARGRWHAGDVWTELGAKGHQGEADVTDGGAHHAGRGPGARQPEACARAALRFGITPRPQDVGRASAEPVSLVQSVEA